MDEAIMLVEYLQSTDANISFIVHVLKILKIKPTGS